MPSCLHLGIYGLFREVSLVRAVCFKRRPVNEIYPFLEVTRRIYSHELPASHRFGPLADGELRMVHETVSKRLLGASCPCASGLAFDECCGPFILGSSLPVRAVSLMRSRYTAFAIKAEDYLADTWHKSTRPSKIELKADQTLWLTLKILKTEAGEAADDGGMVEFEAWYAVDGRMGCQRETSRFVRENGRWLYVDGIMQPRTAPDRKIGRNELCPCGSGKKYKQCHGALS